MESFISAGSSGWNQRTGRTKLQRKRHETELKKCLVCKQEELERSMKYTISGRKRLKENRDERHRTSRREGAEKVDRRCS